ncbi:MAG: hypothetical protein ACREFE_11285 [Limisphaerales bacterium]
MGTQRAVLLKSLSKTRSPGEKKVRRVPLKDKDGNMVDTVQQALAEMKRLSNQMNRQRTSSLNPHTEICGFHFKKLSTHNALNLCFMALNQMQKNQAKRCSQGDELWL